MLILMAYEMKSLMILGTIAVVINIKDKTQTIIITLAYSSNLTFY